MTVSVLIIASHFLEFLSLSFAELRRLKDTGRKVFPSDQPSASMRTPAELIAGVVKNTLQQLCLLAVAAAEERIINYRHRLPAASCKTIDLCDKPAHDQIQEFLPVKISAVEKTVSGILFKR